MRRQSMSRVHQHPASQRAVARRGRWRCVPALARPVPPGQGGFTLVELLVCVAILTVLSTLAVVHLREAHTRAKVAASRLQLRTLGGALDAYRVDQGHYPQPQPVLPDDPFGIFAVSTLAALTTPIAYVGWEAMHDPFGLIVAQTASITDVMRSKSTLSAPVPLNRQQSILYYHYPYFSWLVGQAGMAHEAFCAASLGPDAADSFIVYYPFPTALPQGASSYGIRAASDTVYDPTNGTVSTGDLAAFGGELAVPPIVGGTN